MKLTALLSLAVILPALAHAAPLAAPASVQASPDESAPVIAVLPAGTTPTPATNSKTPAGWTAVTLAGPHTVFVNDHDVLKNFDVKPGASYYAAPETSAPVLTTATDSDDVQITGLSGHWLQVSLKRSVTGYIQNASKPVAAPVAVIPTPVVQDANTTTAYAPATVNSTAPAPVATRNAEPATAGRAVESGGSSLPRIFQGTLVSSRSAFRPRRPYDYQINDSRGVRYAYLDLRKLLMTEQIDTYLGLTVEIFGTASNLDGTKDIVIKVETLKLP